jgi:hypothetical protein
MEIPAITLAEHPRASASIRRAKARGGLAGFALGVLAAWIHGGVLLSVVERGLVGGVLGYLVAWAASLTVWRYVVRAEARAAIERRRRALAAAAKQ